MKKYLAAVWVLFFSLSQAEEINKTVQCTETRRLFNWIESEYNEKLFIVFQQDDTEDVIALTINPATKTWSMVEYNTKRGCLLSSGSDYKVNNRNISPRPNS